MWIVRIAQLPPMVQTTRAMRAARMSAMAVMGLMAGAMMVGVMMDEAEFERGEMVCSNAHVGTHI
jgi:hypothetical protein